MPVPATGNFRVYPRTIASITNNFSVTSNLPLGLKTTPVDTIDAGGASTLAYLKNPSVGAVAPFSGRSVLINSTNWFDCSPLLLYNSATGEYSISLNVDTSAIIFNPGTPEEQEVDILSGQFPAGFLATALRIVVVGTATAVQNATEAPTASTYYTNTGNSLTSIELTWNGFVIDSLSVPTYTGATTFFNYSGASDSDAIVDTGSYVTAASSFGNIGIKFNLAAGGLLNYVACPAAADAFVNAWFRLNEIYLIGDYITESIASNLVVTPVIAAPGEIITIEDPDEGLDDFQDCDAESGDSAFSASFLNQEGEFVTITFPCYSIIERNRRRIRLLLPPELPGGGTEFFIEGVTFEGTVPIVTLNQILANGSGVYKLNKNKRNDTYYDRTDPDAPTTIDLKIHNPNIRTGFF